MLLNLSLFSLVLKIKIFRNMRTLITLMLFLEQSAGGSVASPKFLRTKYFDFKRPTVFCWDKASQCTKRQEILEIWGLMPPLATLVTPMPGGDLLGPCERPGARRHHVGDPCSVGNLSFIVTHSVLNTIVKLRKGVGLSLTMPLL